MAQERQNIYIAAPGFKGLNTQDSPVTQDASFASIAENKAGNSELTENSFIFLDCAMEEAKEVLYEIKKENEED